MIDWPNEKTATDHLPQPLMRWFKGCSIAPMSKAWVEFGFGRQSGRIAYSFSNLAEVGPGFDSHRPPHINL